MRCLKVAMEPLVIGIERIAIESEERVLATPVGLGDKRRHK